MAQPPLPLQEFLPLQPLSPDLQPPSPLHEFWPLQPCLSDWKAPASTLCELLLTVGLVGWAFAIAGAATLNMPLTAALSKRDFTGFVMHFSFEGVVASMDISATSRNGTAFYVRLLRGLRFPYRKESFRIGEKYHDLAVGVQHHWLNLLALWR